MGKKEVALMTVGELTRRIKELLELEIGFIRVSGEISNVRTASSGHCYFVLKDEEAAINCVMFRTDLMLLPFEPKDGQKVEACGELTVYEPRGQYQIIVESMKESGLGELFKAFEALKKKLEKEGLFDKQYKKPLPFLPRRIGIVTSPTGAAIRDLLNVLSRRFENLHIYLYPVRVQGKEAAGEIVHAIEAFNRLKNVDVLIVGRGGGSIEDLWPFNEEIVARAIFASEIPVISAVGHEIDFTISDFVADLRAPTPSAAAELVTKNQLDLLNQLQNLNTRLSNAIFIKISFYKITAERLLRSYALHQPRERLRLFQQRLDELLERIQIYFYNKKEWTKAQLESFIERLKALNPRAIMARGYSIVYLLSLESQQGDLLHSKTQIVKDARQVKIGDGLRIELYQGKLEAKVEKKKEPKQ